jgi:hypothetical protein
MSTSLDLSMDQRADGTWVMTAAGEIDMSNAGACGEGLARARAKAGDGRAPWSWICGRSGTSTRPA